MRRPHFASMEEVPYFLILFVTYEWVVLTRALDYTRPERLVYHKRSSLFAHL
jgi:hypothetical protein